ncbi:unnamed protein product [Paramecium sonneborni]|uniref:FCP1 homology domain-containing protein n=1 Tax=Paramecium sonneborni TaxID=65129 RepID=A0A8S1KM56_9CILI|nr:unnamed protein product [Paramecium sonneborni]
MSSFNTKLNFLQSEIKLLSDENTELRQLLQLNKQILKIQGEFGSTNISLPSVPQLSIDVCKTEGNFQNDKQFIISNLIDENSKLLSINQELREQRDHLRAQNLLLQQIEIENSQRILDIQTEKHQKFIDLQNQILGKDKQIQELSDQLQNILSRKRLKTKILESMSKVLSQYYQENKLFKQENKKISLLLDLLTTDKNTENKLNSEQSPGINDSSYLDSFPLKVKQTLNLNQQITVPKLNINKAQKIQQLNVEKQQESEEQQLPLEQFLTVDKKIYPQIKAQTPSQVREGQFISPNKLLIQLTSLADQNKTLSKQLNQYKQKLQDELLLTKSLENKLDEVYRYVLELEKTNEILISSQLKLTNTVQKLKELICKEKKEELRSKHTYNLSLQNERDFEKKSKKKPTQKIIVNRGISQIRNASDQEETEQLPLIKPKSVTRSSKKNFEIKKVRIKVAISDDKLEINNKQNKLNPIKQEESPQLSDRNQSPSSSFKKTKEDNNRSILKKSIHQDYEIDDTLEDNLESFVKLYHSIVCLMDAIRKNVSDLVDQINRFLEILDGIHFCQIEKLLIENTKQFRQILVLIKIGIVVIINSFFDQHLYTSNIVNFKNILIYNLQNYLILGDMILLKTQKQELQNIINQNKKYFGSKKVDSNTQIRQNVELLSGLYKSLTKQSKDLYQFICTYLKQIPYLRILESNLVLQNFISLYFTMQQSYHGLLGIPLICVANKPYLPTEGSHEFTLILDMDETLIHFIDQTKSFLIRPYLEQFLQEMSKYYEIAVFTAGLPDYANWILDQVDKNKYIQYRLYRQHAMQYQNHFVKDLSRLGRNLKKVIIVDNIADNFQHQPENGIFIKTWLNDQDDKELLELSIFLKKLVENGCEDVREVLKQYKSQQLPQI